MNLPSVSTYRDPVELIADLALYGVALRDEPEFTAPATLPDGPQLRLEFIAGQRQGFAEHAAPLRNFAARNGTLLTHPELLATLALAAVGEAVVLLPLAPVESPVRFLSHLAPQTCQAVRSRMLVLTEKRRRALGLSATLSAGVLHQRILTDGLGPSIATQLAQFLGLESGRLALVDPDQTFDAKPCELVLPRLSAGDPLSVNLIALAIRRGFFGLHPKALGKYFVVSPHGFGRRLAREPQLQPGDVAAALAACQFSFLSLH